MMGRGRDKTETTNHTHSDTRDVTIIINQRPCVSMQVQLQHVIVHCPTKEKKSANKSQTHPCKGNNLIDQPTL